MTESTVVVKNPVSPVSKFSLNLIPQTLPNVEVPLSIDGLTLEEEFSVRNTVEMELLQRCITNYMPFCQIIRQACFLLSYGVPCEVPLTLETLRVTYCLSAVCLPQHAQHLWSRFPKFNTNIYFAILFLSKTN